MRASSAHNRKPDRERLVFAICQECEKVTAIYVAKGQDLAAILDEHKMRPVEGIYRRDVVSIKCASCCHPPIPLDQMRRDYQLLMAEREDKWRDAGEF